MFAFSGVGTYAHVHGIQLLRVEAQRHTHGKNGATRVTADQRILYGS